MNAQDFRDKWQKPLVRYTLASSAAQGLSDDVREMLTRTGLPASAEPWLFFGETDQVSHAAYYPIGQLPNGSVICVETATDRIVIDDGVEGDAPWLLNSSLEALYESIVLYDAFIREVLRRNPRYSVDYKIPEGMLKKLTDDLTACDPDAFVGEGFWFNAVRALDDSDGMK
ncbi:MAG: SUKH-4 family immunity protein [Clostridia bacterium]|nr:SUKH-4 family immunity protein [Clostridia bacterium]MBQ4397108.1 SUKH-4 family immunity protein [Clostridia bacterium]